MATAAVVLPLAAASGAALLVTGPRPGRRCRSTDTVTITVEGLSRRHHCQWQRGCHTQWPRAGRRRPAQAASATWTSTSSWRLNFKKFLKGCSAHPISYLRGADSPGHPQCQYLTTVTAFKTTLQRGIVLVHHPQAQLGSELNRPDPGKCSGFASYAFHQNWWRTSCAASATAYAAT